MNLKKNIVVIILAILTILVMGLALTGIINDILGMMVAFTLFLAFTIIMTVNAHKNGVKFVEYVMILFMVITLVLLGVTVKTFIKGHNESKYKFQVLVTNNTSEKTKLFSYGGHDYYTYNLSDVSIMIEESHEKKSLEDALNNNDVTLDEILKLTSKDSNTSGYSIYYDGGQAKYDNDEYSIVVCENANKDVIFSKFDYKFNESICK